MVSPGAVRCLFCRPLPRPVVRATSRRNFSIKGPSAIAGKSHPSIKASELAKQRNPSDDNVASYDADPVQPYTERERKLLALRYTPAQLRAIEAGEAAIDPRDIVRQGRRRVGPSMLEYRDDFSRILPAVDKPVRAPDENIDPDIRMRSEKETKMRFFGMMEALVGRERELHGRQGGKSGGPLAQEVQELVKEAAIGPDDGRTPQQRMVKFKEILEQAYGPDPASSFASFASDMENFTYSPKGTANSQSSSLSVDLPTIDDPNHVYKSRDPKSEEAAPSRLGRPGPPSASSLRKSHLVFHRVANQTRLGKIQGFYSLVCVGDGNGLLGLGEGNASDASASGAQAQKQAIRNMRPIARYENRTIYGDIEAKVGASVVQLSARPPGFGNRCQFLIFEIARVAGIQDLSARCVRSKNPMNVCKAVYKALTSQKEPDAVARARGIKMVDVRKVYYQGRAV